MRAVAFAIEIAFAHYLRRKRKGARNAVQPLSDASVDAVLAAIG